MLPKLIACWNFTKCGIDEFSIVLNNHKSTVRGSNGYAFIWIILILSGVQSIYQVAKAAWISPRLYEHKSLEQLSGAFSRHGSFCKTLHAISKNVMLEDVDCVHWEDLDPDATISDCVTTLTSSSEVPLYHKKLNGRGRLVVRKCEHQYFIFPMSLIRQANAHL